MPAEILRDADACYRVVSSRDPRWDGRLYLGVLSTGVYCRPSCPARTPRAENCRFYPTAAAAVAAGFRACRRCRPDALPGSREDDHRADLAARALRLIRDGEVDAGGVAGLAARLHVSERHLHRVLVAEVGVGPLRLAATRRAQTARLLIDQTDMGMADVAFAAGFASIRQFNDVMRAEFGCPPRELRRPALDGRAPVEGGPGLTLRLRYREPYAADAVWGFLTARTVPGVEAVGVDGALRRPVPAPSGTPAVVEVSRPCAGVVPVRLEPAELADLGAVVARVRRWLDLDADPLAVDEALAADPGLAPLVRARPGLRVPGTVDGFELAARAVVGQQVSVAGARTLLGRLVAAVGAGPGFPSAASVVAAGAEALGACGLTGARAVALHRLAHEVADGRLVLDPGADRRQVRAALLALPGIGPWTASYVALRALADPDSWPDHDAVLRREVRAHGWDPARWRPWRGYAALHVWTAAAAGAGPGTAVPAAVARPRGVRTITFGTDTRTLRGESTVHGVSVPGKGVPDVAVPDVAVPDVAVPDVAVADVAVADVAVLDVAVPEAGVPDVAVPEAGVLADSDASAAVRPDGPLSREGELMSRPGTAVLPTLGGDLALVVDSDGTVLAAGYTALDTLLRRRGLPPGTPPADPSALVGVVSALDAYAAGDGAALDAVRVVQPGTAFQHRVWEAMRAVPPGRPVTYADLAAQVGAPGAARAVGQACSRNLAAPFVPCHRVVPAGGGVGGYAYGAGVKTTLLAHERAAAGAAAEAAVDAERGATAARAGGAPGAAPGSGAA